MQEVHPFYLSGTLQMPASKSVMQRALLLSAFADGQSILQHTTWSNDALACHDAIQYLGATTEKLEQQVLIKGLQNYPEQAALNLGESGLAFRMFTGFLACIPGKFQLSAKGSLLKRPLKPIIDSLSSLGIQAKDEYPFTIHGAEPKKEISLDGSFSSQFITGVIIALATKSDEHILRLQDPKSLPYIQLSLEMIQSFGAQVRELGNHTYAIIGKKNLSAQNIELEADWSAASNFIVAAALRGKIELKGLLPTSAQADKAIIELLDNAGASYVLNEGHFKIEEQQLPAFDFDAEHCPDLFPALVLLAAGIKGSSRIQGTNRLIHKESNRLEALMQNFGKQGLQITQEENAFIIRGTGSLNAAKLDSFNDHRMAMIAAMSATLCKSKVQIIQPNSVAKSYPEFYKDLKLASKAIKQLY